MKTNRGRAAPPDQPGHNFAMKLGFQFYRPSSRQTMGQVLTLSLNRSFIRGQAILTALEVAALSFFLPKASFAQTGGAIDTTQIEASVTALSGLIQTLAGITLLLALMAAGGLTMWGGFSANMQRMGIRGATFAIIGAALCFLFAAPLSTFFVSTFQAGAGTTG